MDGPLAVLVNVFSASNGRPGENNADKVLAIDRNHSQMVKFSPREVNYIIVLGFLKEIAASARDVINNTRQEIIIQKNQSNANLQLV